MWLKWFALIKSSLKCLACSIFELEKYKSHNAAVLHKFTTIILSIIIISFYLCSYYIYLKNFMKLLKLQLVSLPFICPFSCSYTDMRNSTRTLVRCLNKEDPLRASTLLRSREVEWRRQGGDGFLLRRTLRADRNNWTTCRRMKNPWKVFVLVNFPKTLKNSPLYRVQKF